MKFEYYSKNKDKYSITELKKVSELYEDIISEVNKYDCIEYHDGPNSTSFAMLKSINFPSFTFHILARDPQDASKLEVHYRPRSEKDNGFIAEHVFGLSWTQCLKDWIKLIKEYERLTLSWEKDSVAEEHYSILKLEGKSANFVPFDLEKRLVLRDYLLKVSEEIDEIPNNEEGKNLTKEIYDSIATSNQNSVLRKLSKLFSWIEKRSPEVCWSVIKIFIANVLLDASWEGVEHVKEAINFYRNLPGMLK